MITQNRDAPPSGVLGVLVHLVLTTVVCALALLVPAGPAAAEDEAKVYVVRSAEENGGKDEFLFDIAERTLGDGERFREIFKLNQGRPQPDGDALTNPSVVVAGWILLLPKDASGPDVRLARLTDSKQPPQDVSPPSAEQPSEEQPSTDQPSGDQPPAQQPERRRAPAPAEPPAAGGGGTSPLLLGGAVAVALTVAGVGAWLLIRRRRGAGPITVSLPFTSWFRGLGRRRLRTSLARQFAKDKRTTLSARRALRELVELSTGTPVEVYTVLAEERRLVAAARGGDGSDAGRWRHRSDTRWEYTGPPSLGPAHPGDDAVCPHLVAIGVTDDDALAMVDLDRIEGILSVGGNTDVARDTLMTVARGLLDAPKSSTTVVLVDPLGEEMPGHLGLRRVRTPAELNRRRPAPVAPRTRSFVHGGQLPDQFAGFIVVLHPVGESDARELARLSSPELGWTVLTVGDAPGAHWRWSASSDGTLDTGVLDLRVLVPAFTAITTATTTAGPPRRPGGWRAPDPDPYPARSYPTAQVPRPLSPSGGRARYRDGDRGPR